MAPPSGTTTVSITASIAATTDMIVGMRAGDTGRASANMTGPTSADEGGRT
jgi:hypothetical protein